jgi:outer membrane lipoprotein-sorting protein
MKGTSAALLLGVATTCGCVGLQARLVASATTDGLFAIDSYRARISERGLLRDDPTGVVVKELVYERPWRLRAEVVAPSDHVGHLFVSDGSTMTVWWPRFFFGLRIRGLVPPERDEVEAVTRERVEWTLERYDVTKAGGSVQAGRDVDIWAAAPTGSEQPYRAWLDTEYHVPLKVSIAGPDAREWYGMAFDTFELGVAVPADSFTFEFPERAIVHEWDLSAPGVTLAEAQERVEFPILVAPGLEVEKVVMSTGEGDPMVALVMRQGARWLSISEMPNLGPILVPEIGIPVPIGAEEGVLNFAFGYTVLSWSVGTTALTLIGNLPHSELLELAASLRPLAP